MSKNTIKYSYLSCSDSTFNYECIPQILTNNFCAKLDSSNTVFVSSLEGKATIAIKSDLSLWGWGASCAVATGPSPTNCSSPVQILTTVSGGTVKWKNITISSEVSYAGFAFATSNTGNLYSWGMDCCGARGTNRAGNNDYANNPTRLGITGDSSCWSEASAGERHTTAIKCDGTLWAWGYNGAGNLGDNTSVNKSSPIQIGTDNTWCKSISGCDYSFGLKTDGTLWAWGYARCGVLGTNNSVANPSSPVQVGANTNWAKISVSSCVFVHAIKKDGTLWAWGCNGVGNLGDNTTTNYASPIQIGTDTTWASVCNTSRTTFAVKTDGTLWAWGSGCRYDLGAGSTTNYSSPVQIGNCDSDWFAISNAAAVKCDGRTYFWGDTGKTAFDNGNGLPRFGIDFQIPPVIPCYFDFSDKFINRDLFSRGEVYGLGCLTLPTGAVVYSSPTQLNMGSNWKTISGSPQGVYGSFAGVKTDGSLYVWGDNCCGHLGTNNLTSLSSPVQLASDKKWRDASFGGYSSLFLDQTGKMWASGNNLCGELGDGTKVKKSSPVAIGGSENWKKIVIVGTSTQGRSAGIKTDGTLWTWGDNSVGQLGINAVTPRSSPVQTSVGGTTWKDISIGPFSSFAVKTDGTLWAWGSGTCGVLGVSSVANLCTPTQVGTNTNWQSVAYSSDSNVLNGGSTLAIKTDGTLWAWGWNCSGQLGKNNTTNYSSPIQVGTDAGWKEVFTSGSRMMIATKLDGTIWQWGGIGYALCNLSSPVQIGTDVGWRNVVNSVGPSGIYLIKPTDY